MKKSTIAGLVVIALMVIWGVSAYNGMVTKEEGVTKSWGNVESQYQRRADLIPNLVNTVKGYATHEEQTFEAVVSARAKATSITLDATNMTSEQLQEFQKAQGEIGSALSRLIAVSEAYPELKANENFKELQAQLEGTENRIAVERKNFNESVQSFNTSVRRFPKNIIANLCGFQTKPYFEAEESSKTAPKVDF